MMADETNEGMGLMHHLDTGAGGFEDAMVETHSLLLLSVEARLATQVFRFQELTEVVPRFKIEFDLEDSFILINTMNTRGGENPPEKGEHIRFEVASVYPFMALMGSGDLVDDVIAVSGEDRGVLLQFFFEPYLLLHGHGGPVNSPRLLLGAKPQREEILSQFIDERSDDRFQIAQGPLEQLKAV